VESGSIYGMYPYVGSITYFSSLILKLSVEFYGSLSTQFYMVYFKFTFHHHIYFTQFTINLSVSRHFLILIHVTTYTPWRTCGRWRRTLERWWSPLIANIKCLPPPGSPIHSVYKHRLESVVATSTKSIFHEHEYNWRRNQTLACLGVFLL